MCWKAFFLAMLKMGAMKRFDLVSGLYRLVFEAVESIKQAAQKGSRGVIESHLYSKQEVY